MSPVAPGSAATTVAGGAAAGGRSIRPDEVHEGRRAAVENPARLPGTALDASQRIRRVALHLPTRHLGRNLVEHASQVPDQALRRQRRRLVLVDDAAFGGFERRGERGGRFGDILVADGLERRRPPGYGRPRAARARAPAAGRSTPPLRRRAPRRPAAAGAGRPPAGAHAPRRDSRTCPGSGSRRAASCRSRQRRSSCRPPGRRAWPSARRRGDRSSSYDTGSAPVHFDPAARVKSTGCRCPIARMSSRHHAARGQIRTTATSHQTSEPVRAATVGISETGRQHTACVSVRRSSHSEDGRMARGEPNRDALASNGVFATVEPDGPRAKKPM